MHGRTGARTLIVALIATLGATLTACGGSRDTPTADPHSPSAMQSADVTEKPTVAAAAAATPWSGYMLAPSSRTLTPVAIYKTNGTVQNPNNLLTGNTAMMSGRGSYVVLDFGKEVGGFVTLDFPTAGSSNESVGLAFTESSEYVGPISDGSNTGLNVGASSSTDGAIYASVNTTAGLTYTMPTASLRGGFRYLTLFMNSDGWVHLANIRLSFTPAPLMADPSAYPNFFYSNDDLLNKLWYAGAYTVQTNTIAPNQGRKLISTGWDNSAVVSGGTSVLTDAAKRDRTVWSGDLGVSAATAFVSTADTLSVKNALQRMYDSQKASGELPYSGPPFDLYGSDTYHLWSLIGTDTYYLYSGDIDWLRSIWPKYKLGMSFIQAKVNGAHGLLNMTGTNDWARNNQVAENIAPNVMLYRALSTGAGLATALGDSTLAASYASAAATLKSRINSTLWDATIGAYRDNPGSTLYPQDGNSLAVWYGVTDTADKPAAVTRYLNGNLGTLGALTPEWGNNISCFAGSMQLMAMSLASRDVDALNLIRRQWGFMFNHPTRSTKTFWEGFGADGGSGGYAPWFMSYAHGWSTGPTSALTFFTLGISPTAAKGVQYSVIPHPGDLTHVEGQLTFDGSKRVKNSYDRGSDGAFSMTVDSSSNTGSLGVIGIPRFGIDRRVTIDNVEVWNGSSFSGAGGIASADQDSRYIYFRGVQPGVRTFRTAGTAGAWASCASEGGQCVFEGTRGVRYGSGSSFVYGSFNASVACTNATFGDPTPSVLKHCELSDTELPPAPGIWAACANEGQSCSFDHTKTVAYGAQTSYRYAARTSPVACDNNSFVDPIFGVAKRCYVSNLPQNAGFELPAVTAANGLQYGVAGAGWTFSPENGTGGAGLQKNGSAFGASAAPEGTQTAFVQTSGAMSQSLPDLSAGKYAVRFTAARRGWSGGGQQTLGVYLDDTLLGSYAPGSTLFDAFTSGSISLGAGTHTLRFAGQNVSGDNTAFVDAVTLINY